MKDEIVQEDLAFSYTLKVPKDRIAVFIGEKGQMKRQLAKELGVKFEVDSREGDVTATSKDSLKLFVAKDVIKAIARGFNPDVATLLTKQDYALEVVDIVDFANTKDSMTRLKGRVIGVQGKSRDHIEGMTGCYISVYGKTVCIIGEAASASVAKRAVEALLSGNQHTAVSKFLEKQRKNLRDQSM